MAKVGQASTPLDLMTYEPEDEQPSIFFLLEGQRQAMLTVFNWTNTVRSHTLKLADLGLPAGHTFAAMDVLNQNATVTLVGGAVHCFCPDDFNSASSLQTVTRAITHRKCSDEAERVPKATPQSHHSKPKRSRNNTSDDGERQNALP